MLYDKAQLRIGESMEDSRAHKVSYLVAMYGVHRRFMYVKQATVLFVFGLVLAISLAIEYVYMSERLMKQKLCFPEEQGSIYAPGTEVNV